MKEAALPAEILTAEWVLPVCAPPIPQGFVRMEAGRIMAVGRLAELGESEGVLPPKPGSLLTPGLVNVHTHLEQSYPEAIPKSPEQPFTEWLLAVFRRNKGENYTPEARRLRCEAGIRELLASGTTCVNDIASRQESLQALDAAGMRGIVSLEFVNPDTAVTIDDTIERYREFSERYRGHSRLGIGISPHSPYNVSPPAWQNVLDACGNPFIHTHAGEFQAEVDFLQGRPSDIQILHQAILQRRFSPTATAETPVAYLQRFRLLTAGMVVAHAVHSNALDREALAEAGAGVAHCPRSNLALHGKTLHYADWTESGVSMGLGTDGKLSTPDLNLRAEARLAMALHGWDTGTALRIMTYEGARVMGLAHRIGTLEPGKQADLVLWQSEGSGSPVERLMQAETKAQRVHIEGISRWQSR